MSDEWGDLGMRFEPESKADSVAIVLRQIREDKQSLSQMSVALACGMQQSTLSRIEAGETSLDVPTLYRICKVLEVTPEEVFSRAEVLWQQLEAKT